MRQISSDNIVHMEKRATNKVGLVLVAIFVIIIFGGGGFLLYKYKDHIDWELKLPWQSSTKKEQKEEKEKNKKKKNNRELIVPTDLQRNSTGLDGCYLTITGVKADDRGYIISSEFSSEEQEWCILKVSQILINGYYTTTNFEISDTAGGEKAKKEFRINKTELDSMNITTLRDLTLFLSTENPTGKERSKINTFVFTNEIHIKDGREGLLKVDEKGNSLIEYYKTDFVNDGTYIYFEVFNGDVVYNKTIKIKKLMINNRLYEMPEFEAKAYRGARNTFCIKIPVKKIKDVEEIQVSFYILTENEKGEPIEMYITNEFHKKY